VRNSIFSALCTVLVATYDGAEENRLGTDRKMRLVAAVFGAFLTAVRVSGIDIGFRQIQVPDPPGKPLAVEIWYPTNSRPSNQPLGFIDQNVALNGAIAGTKLPVVFISHGTGVRSPATTTLRWHWRKRGL